MSKTQKQLQKKKAREKSAKEKVAKIRTQIRAAAKEKREEFRKDKLIRKIKRDMEGLDVWADDIYKKMPVKTLEQLQHNAKILKSLEEDYESQMNERKERQQAFKDQGIDTLDGMVEAMHNDLAVEQGMITEENLEQKVSVETDETTDVSTDE